MLWIFALIFGATLASAIGGYGLARWYQDDRLRRRLELLTYALRKHTHALQAAIAATRPPAQTGDSRCRIRSSPP